MVINITNKKRPLVWKSFSIDKEIWDNLDKALREAGYPDGVKSINKSEMVERLLEEFIGELESDNKEDEAGIVQENTK